MHRHRSRRSDTRMKTIRRIPFHETAYVNSAGLVAYRKNKEKNIYMYIYARRTHTLARFFSFDNNEKVLCELQGNPRSPIFARINRRGKDYLWSAEAQWGREVWRDEESAARIKGRQCTDSRLVRRKFLEISETFSPTRQNEGKTFRRLERLAARHLFPRDSAPLLEGFARQLAAKRDTPDVIRIAPILNGS